ncbi:peptidyl-prolyl cis-trans isomerase [Stieleria sp. JC731]|uniref:peptidylprolyl isomerase n=1 Tax=Pirellulaceae TaxID=2691357 RepID=UPI001E4B372B|nr:peptidylprolyl isomerase [Stieleria sp. JC731]MCC9599262.1 peptidyl-prolyl cis-trans isomerase [Stieleria sp. JC731]
MRRLRLPHYATGLIVLLVALQVRAQALPEGMQPLPEDPAAVMAVVGQSSILWGDIEPKVESRIREVLSQTRQQIPEEQLLMARVQLSRSALRNAIQSKVMSECFLLEQVGTQSADKRAEVSAMMSQRARQLFFENELQALKKKFGTESLSEIDAKLRETGTSLQARQREFGDMMLGHMYMKEKIDQDPNVTIAEINNFYEKNKDDYQYPAKARWEQLSVLFKNHPTRKAAMEKLLSMGREIYNWEQNLKLSSGEGPSSVEMVNQLTAAGGINFNKSWEQIARDGSEESYAPDGGQHDWTSKGALASKELDSAIFSVKPETMSEIIEDAQGLHIIRVKERKTAGVTPLREVQEDIREEIKKSKISKAQEAMLAQMQKRVPVWSLYPDDFPGAQQLPVTIASRPASNSASRR